MDRKKRILTCLDAHFLSTGYGKYVNEVFTRLAKTDKYELAELACYGEIDSPKANPKGWTYYANAVPGNHPQYKEYSSRHINELGAWRWERTVLDFQPDIVFDIRDPYHSTFIFDSPLREFYHLCMMPTIDAVPQKNEWIDYYRLSDSLMVYSEWAKPILESYRLKVSGIASPGIDTNVFRPIPNKKIHKNTLGIPENSYIVGTVMRNQTRKLYPDICRVIRAILDNGPKEIVEKLFFYFHVGYPDTYCWNIPELLQEFNIGHKVFFTYICSTCKSVLPSLYRDTNTPCFQCGSKAKLASPSNGVDEKQLAHIINTFDLYLQYATNEGFGVPLVEAAGCGIPIMSLDYSAVSDIIRNTGGIAIKPLEMSRDSGTASYRAVPNNSDAVRQIINFFYAQQSYRDELAILARSGVLQHYTWDKCAKTWEDHFDNIVLSGNQGRYNIPARQFKSIDPPENLLDDEFVDWLITNIWHEPRLKNSYRALQIKQELGFGAKKHGKNQISVDRKSLLQDSYKYLANKQECEYGRTHLDELNQDDFIVAAKFRKEME